MNDIDVVSKIINLILFADDTNVFFSHNNLNSLIDTLSIETAKLTDWFVANKLSLNLKKTNFMIFKPRQRKISEVKLSINNQKINCVEQTVFLGVRLDSDLSWNSHISYVANKISKSIYNISNI